MRNMLIAYAALGLLAVASSVNAQSPEHVIQDVATAAVQGVQADAAVADTIVDTQAVQSQSIMQPMNQQYEVIQGDNAMIAQSNVVHQHQPVHYYHHPHQHRVQAKKQGPLQKLIELEKKKNAWLRKTFLGK